MTPDPEEFTDEENAIELALQEADTERSMVPWFDDDDDHPDVCTDCYQQPCDCSGDYPF